MLYSLKKITRVTIGCDGSVNLTVGIPFQCIHIANHPIITLYYLFLNKTGGGWKDSQNKKIFMLHM